MTTALSPFPTQAPASDFRLLVCLPFLTPSVGGGAYVLLNLLEPLSRQGFALQVVCFQPEALPLVPPGLRTHLFPKRTGSAAYYLEYPRLLRSMARLLRDFQPHAVLCNAYQPYWICAAARELAGSTAALVNGEQNNLDEMFRGAKWGRLRRWLVRRLGPLADRVVVPCEGLRRHLVGDYAVPAAKVSVIGNPMPLERIRSLAAEDVDHPWFAAGACPVVLNVGLLGEQKDQRTLLKAFAALRRERPLRCVFIGEGPERQALRQEAQELGVAADVDFLGFQKNPYRFMARSEVFVLSSIYEGFGNVLLEAMACGCPVVSTRCPYGPEEIVTHGVDGLLCPPGEPAALASGIRRVLGDAALARSLRENGRRRAGQFSARDVAASYAEVLKACRPA